MNKTEAYNKITATIKEFGNPDEYMGEYGELRPEDIEDKEIAALFEGQESVYHFGGEGEGDHYETVWHFPVPDIYVSFYGWYASHHGSEYESMGHVEPVQVMKTEYHTFKGE